MKTYTEDISIKEKLLQTGLDLFSNYGFDATSTRMIAEKAGITRSSIAFYFKTKESFYDAVIDEAIETLRRYHEPIYLEVTKEMKEHILTPDGARCHIFRILKRQLDWFLLDEYKPVVRLIFDEQHANPENSKFYDVLYTYVLNPMIELIMTTTGLTDRDEATMLCISIHGIVQPMGEYKTITNKLFSNDGDQASQEAFKERFINFTLDNARAVLDRATII